MKDILEAALFINLNEDEIHRLETFITVLDENAFLAEMFKYFSQKLITNYQSAMLELKSSNLESMIDRESAWTFYFLLSLSQISPAITRREEYGISKEMSASMMADMQMRLRLSQSKSHVFGIPYETLEWFQEYLSGNLVRFGAMHFKTIHFPRKIKIYENKLTKILLGASFEDPSGPLVIDLSNGELTSKVWDENNFDEKDWEMLLRPDLFVVKMHLPHDANLDKFKITDSIKEAFNFFNANSNHQKLHGLFGEAWLLEPAFSIFIKNSEMRALIKGNPLFPSIISELNTIKRFFEYDDTRETLLNSEKEYAGFQGFIVKRLKTPGDELKAKGLFSSMKMLKELGCIE